MNITAFQPDTLHPEQLSEVKALKPEAIFAKPVEVAAVWREAG